MNNDLVVKKDMEWDTMDQQLNEYDKMFCHMLFYCLKDELKRKEEFQGATTEEISQEVCNG